MIKLTNNGFLSLELQKSLSALHESIREYNAISSPLTGISEAIRIEVKPLVIPQLNIEPIANSMQPLTESISSFQKAFSEVLTTIPDLDTTTISLYDELTSEITSSIETNSFPLETSYKWTSNDIDSYLDDKIKESIDPSLYSDIQEYEQLYVHEDLTDHSLQPDTAHDDNQNKSENTLKSDLTSKDWHMRMWVESIYQHLIGFFIAFIYGLINRETLDFLISTLIDVLNN